MKTYYKPFVVVVVISVVTVVDVVGVSSNCLVKRIVNGTQTVAVSTIPIIKPQIIHGFLLMIFVSLEKMN